MNRALPYLRLARPAQWIKSGFVFAPLIFSLHWHDRAALANTALAFAAFVLVSVIGYIVNDIHDASFDRLHAVKRQRPIAAGEVSRGAAELLALALGIAALGLAAQLPVACGWVLALYLLLSIAYSLKLKHVAVLDVVLIGCGFVLRLKMGGYAADVALSPWIIQVTFLLALFLGFAKRYQELAHGAGGTRRALDGYTKPLLEQLITICCGATLLAYAVYAIDMAERLSRPDFVYSAIFVAFGLFRYLQHVHRDRGGDAPELLLLRDPLFAFNLLGWFAFSLWQMGAVQ